MSMFENEYRVFRVPLKERPFQGKKWVVSGNGSYISGYHTKSAAVKKARKDAKKRTPSSLVIEYQGGGIQDKLEYR